MKRARCAAMMAVITGSAVSVFGSGLAVPASAATTVPHSLLTSYVVKEITDPHDPDNTIVSGINKFGEIAADYGTGTPGDPIEAFILSTPYGKSSIRPISFPGAAQTDIYSLNNKGVIVGQYSMTDHKSGNSWHGFWEKGGSFHTVDYPARPSRPSWDTLSDVNNADIAVGSYDAANGSSHAFRYNIKTHQFSLPVVGPESTVAYSINDVGAIVGFFEAQHGPWFSYVTVNGKLIKFNVRGAGRTEARGINDHGLVIGTYIKSGRKRGFDWVDRGGPHGHIGFFKVPSTWKNYAMQGINNAGKIVGWYEDSTGYHGFVAVPK